MTPEQIARVAHEANRGLCNAFGESQPTWGDAPDWQIDSAKAQVMEHLLKPNASPSDTHALWAAGKLADGWKYGELKCDKAKTHPCLVPFDELPPYQQAKDHLFKAVVGALAPFVESRE